MITEEMIIVKGTERAPFPKSRLPKPIFDEAPECIDLYYKAWELAWDHVYEQEGMPSSPYMDEGFADSVVWIWDTCFMVHFCKYAPDLFPGIESFDNFYACLHDGVELPTSIQHPDNPPLFAWTEYEYYKYTGDDKRIRKLLVEEKYLQKHFEFLERVRSGDKHGASRGCEMYWQKDEFGYQWRGCPSGMDNTPRGLGKPEEIYWVDALSQQILSAHYISLLAEVIGEEKIAEEYAEKSIDLKSILQMYYWDSHDGTFYDVYQNDLTHCKVKTPASYWPMLADACTKNQALRMVQHLNDPKIFGDAMPWPTVSKDDPTYSEDGAYWRGSSWLPTNYMVSRGLQRYEFFDDAHEAAVKIVKAMQETYQNVTPHTIWECYKPKCAEPALTQKGELVREDFCGWSALGPISMLIEQAIGIHDIDAKNKVVKWESRLKTRHGIESLKFGSTVSSMVIDKKRVSVTSNEPYTLIINGKSFEINEGSQEFTLNS